MPNLTDRVSKIKILSKCFQIDIIRKNEQLNIFDQLSHALNRELVQKQPELTILQTTYHKRMHQHYEGSPKQFNNEVIFIFIFLGKCLLPIKSHEKIQSRRIKTRKLRVLITINLEMYLQELILQKLSVIQEVASRTGS